jgi:hypothetical protein
MNARLITSLIVTAALTTGILLGPAFAQAPTPIVRPIPVPNEFKTSDNADARVLKQVPGGVVLNVRSSRIGPLTSRERDAVMEAHNRSVVRPFEEAA